MLLRRGAASSSSSMAFPAPSFYPSSNSASLKCTVVAALDGGAQRRFQHSLEVGDLAAASEPLAQGFGSGGCCWRSQRFEVAAAPPTKIDWQDEVVVVLPQTRPRSPLNLQGIGLLHDNSCLMLILGEATHYAQLMDLQEWSCQHLIDKQIQGT
uniref:Uncharacterized protein n=1 Tax=Oryza glumipatula TaxID=40148 RepID=A0A0D9Z9V3_9ORYZ